MIKSITKRIIFMSSDCMQWTLVQIFCSLLVPLSRRRYSLKCIFVHFIAFAWIHWALKGRDCSAAEIKVETYRTPLYQRIVKSRRHIFLLDASGSLTRVLDGNHSTTIANFTSIDLHKKGDKPYSTILDLPPFQRRTKNALVLFL